MADSDRVEQPDQSRAAPVTAVPDGDWVVIIEAAAAPALQFSQIKDLVARLAGWHPSALYSLERYAVQLRVAAAQHHQAVALAVAAHDQAIRAMSLDAPTLLRVEVMTLGELKSTTEHPAAEPPSGRVYDALVPTALYEATRSLFCADNRAAIDEVLTGFVLTAGGTVNLGDLSYFPGQVSVDLGLSPGDRMYATADAASVAGLMIEQSLPALVGSAERMLARLYPAPQARLR